MASATRTPGAFLLSALRRVADALAGDRVIRCPHVGPGPHGDPDPSAGRVQVEGWRDGDVARLLVVAQRDGMARAFLVCIDVSTGLWSRGTAEAAPSPVRHDRDALAASIPTHPITLDALGNANVVRFSSKDTLARIVLGTMAAPEEARQAIADWAGQTPAPDEQGDGLPGYAGGKRGGPAEADRGRWEGPGRPADPASHVATFDAIDAGDPTLLGRIAHLVFGAGEAIRAAHDFPTTRMLGWHGWSAEAYVFYAARGPLKDRRHQAASLQPAFATTIACAPEVAACVDAGRPFEPALAAVLGPLCGLPAGLTIALMRWLRTLHHYGHPFSLLLDVQYAAKLPVDWVPAAPDGWAAFRQVVSSCQQVLPFI